MKGFKNANVYLTGEGIKKLSVGIENGKIVYIGEDSSKITEEFPVCDNQTVVPGFIDEHTHGAESFDVMDATFEAIEGIAQGLIKEGTTSFLATTMTQSKENIVKALKVIGNYENKKGARVLGVHLEGPFISEKHKGAQKDEYIIKPDKETFDKFNEASNNKIKIVTLAPEKADKEFVEYLNSLEVVASAGHTDATYNQLEEGVNNGVSCVTHLYNAQRSYHHRDIGVVGGALLIDSLNTEMICDLIHVSAPAIKMAFKNKAKERIILITDSIRAKNLPDGESELGGSKVYVKNGEARLIDGTLAGSTLNMNVAIKNLVSIGIPFETAIDCATVNPANNLNVADKYGSIEVNKVADFAVLNQDFSVAMTIKDGEIAFKK